MSRKKFTVTIVPRANVDPKLLSERFCQPCFKKRGVGEKLGFSKALASDTTRCRSAISLPLVAGFGIKEKGAGLQDFDDFQPSRTILECPLNCVLGA